MTNSQYIPIEIWPDKTTVQAKITAIDDLIVNIEGLMVPLHDEPSVIALTLAQVVKVCRKVNICTHTLQLEKDHWFALLPTKAVM